jgi:hypothetical protein
MCRVESEAKVILRREYERSDLSCNGGGGFSGD